MDVLKAHSQRSAEKYTNKYVVLSYHSTITQARDTNYYKQSRSFRDLMKSQNNKTNKLEALIEIGDLENKEYKELGLKGIEFHQYMQDCRQIYHDAAKDHGPFHVRPGGRARFEKEVRYAASTASVEPMQPIELYRAHVDKDQRRLTSRLHCSIRMQVRSNEATRPKAQSAPLRSNYNGHVTGNGIYVPENTSHQRRPYISYQ
jgi:hypothetical protein